MNKAIELLEKELVKGVKHLLVLDETECKPLIEMQKLENKQFQLTASRTNSQ